LLSFFFVLRLFLLLAVLLKRMLRGFDMLVREVSPGDIVTARGWDVAPSNKHSSQMVGYLIPHRGHHKKAVEMGQSINLLYVGPTKVRVGKMNPSTRKMHNFLTETGDLVALSGHEFRYFSPCKNA